MSNRDFSRYISDALRPLRSRIGMMVARGVVTLVKDGLKMQGLQLSIMSDENKDGIERFQNYGVTSVPHPGAEAVVVFLGGNRDHGIAIAVDDRRYRIKGLQNGEVAIYTDEDQEAHKHRIHLKRNGEIEVLGKHILFKADEKLRLEGDGVEIHAKTYLQQDVHGKGSRETHVSGVNYHTDSYVTGSTGDATEHGLDQPHIPSNHPQSL